MNLRGTFMNLEKAIQIAVEAHAGTKDKGGKAYILHPISVMMRVETEEEKIVAILHDVVEDTDWTFDALRKEGFSETVIEALETVTKYSEEEDYDDFIQRSLKNDIGRKVKIADLRENLDVTRIGELYPKDIERINKYKRALQTLKA
jgi:(p)ppGpp synthase/HD superfamily hydrolase